jgi:hypothetical protein
MAQFKTVSPGIFPEGTHGNFQEIYSVSQQELNRVPPKIHPRWFRRGFFP